MRASPRNAINLLFFVNGLVFASWASRLPDLQSQHGLDNHNLGIILLIHSIGAILAMPVTGWLIHKFGSRTMCKISCLLNILLFSLLPLSFSRYDLSILFLGMGASAGILDVAMNAQGVELEKMLQKPIMTFFHAMFSIGMVAGGAIAALANDQELSFFQHGFLISLLALILFFIASVSLINLSELEKLISGRILVLPSGPIIALGFIAFCCMMGEGAMSDWSTIYLLNTIELDAAQATFGLIAFAGCMTLGRLFGDNARKKFGDHRILLSGSITSLAGIILVISLLHPFLVIAGFGLVGIGLSNIVPIVYSLAGSYPGISPGVGIAMSTTIGYSGFMVGPPLIGFISDSYGLQTGLGIFLILFLIMFIITLARKRATN